MQASLLVMSKKEKSFDLPRVLFLVQDFPVESLDIDERIVAYNALRSRFLGISCDVSIEEVALMSRDSLELVLGLIPLLIRENPEAIPAIAQALIPR